MFKSMRTRSFSQIESGVKVARSTGHLRVAGETRGGSDSSYKHAAKAPRSSVTSQIATLHSVKSPIGIDFKLKFNYIRGGECKVRR